MDLIYRSTRNDENKVKASQAILQGLSEDGGLYVPESIPKLDIAMQELAKMSYQDIAYEVMKLYLTDYEEAELKECIDKAYDDKFDTKEIAPVVKKGDEYYLELFHGETIAFKDMALSILPHLLTTAAKKNKIEEDIVILTATSGDTGKAAMAGFADVEGTKIIVFYPKDGVSSVQEKQMLTQEGENTSVIGIRGNFDDAQRVVKEIFSKEGLRELMKESGYRFSSANSINIGRLVPQIVYYVYGYSRLYKNGDIKDGEMINYVVPTGNFGNILAGYYAKNMGVPINKLICASNKNKVLYDFFETGKYDRNREFMLTASPSMDILVSSNLERLIYNIAGNRAEITKGFMTDLHEKGIYEIESNMIDKLDGFYGQWANDEETKEVIKEIYGQSGYVLDTHTGVAASVYHKYKEDTKDESKTIIVSTASPYKFGSTVLEALTNEKVTKDDYAQAEQLEELSNVKIPKAVEDIRYGKIRHTRVCDVNEMESEVKKILKLN